MDSGIFVDYAMECWSVLREAAPYVLLGFLVAGLLKALLPDAWMTRHLGGRGPLSVIKAALVGVPLPLCSCGVVPAALAMRRQGAGPGATTAFMISTPETGADSLAVTWAMIDPLMTLLRPVAAFVTALSAGLAANLLPERMLRAAPALSGVAVASGCGCGGACSAAVGGHAGAMPVRPSLRARLRGGLGESFGEMLADVGGWLLVGILLAAAISLLLPPDFFSHALGGEFTSMLAMLLVGIPMYVCASSSTPIAASLLLKGLSPGAALVFLLSGPATNATTITVMTRSFGPALTAVYVASIAVCSLGFGLLTNRLYAALGYDIHAVIGVVNETLPAWMETLSALLLLALVLRALVLQRLARAAQCKGALAAPGRLL
ncbi:SO_0444 family Cu/Zn efflux transporter [Humidesulfovibrio sp.]